MTGPPNDSLTQTIKLLEDRSYKTYKCRLYAFRRLSHANNASNASLIIFSTSTTIASVGILVNRNMYGSGGDAMLLVLAILSLVASLVVASISYGTRSKAMEANYKRIQQISFAAESLAQYSGSDKFDLYQKLQRDYEVAVESSENHAEADYQTMLAQTSGSPPRTKRKDLPGRLAPYATLVVPVALLVPFAKWFINGL